jgi:hypothetical protein
MNVPTAIAASGSSKVTAAVWCLRHDAKPGKTLGFHPHYDPVFTSTVLPVAAGSSQTLRLVESRSKTYVSPVIAIKEVLHCQMTGFDRIDGARGPLP